MLIQQVAWETIVPEGVLPLKEHTPIVDGRLKIDIALSQDFMTTWREMEKVSDLRGGNALVFDHIAR